MDEDDTEEIDAVIASIKLPVFWEFPSEVCTVDVPELGLTGPQKRMRIVISQDGDNEAHKGSRNGLLGWGFGSSDVAVVCGVGYNGHPEHFWEYLLFMPHERDGGNKLTEHGNHF